MTNKNRTNSDRRVLQRISRNRWGLHQGESGDQAQCPKHDIYNSDYLRRHRHAATFGCDLINVNNLDGVAGLPECQKAQNEAKTKDSNNAHDQSLFRIILCLLCFRFEDIGWVHRIAGCRRWWRCERLIILLVRQSFLPAEDQRKSYADQYIFVSSIPV